MLHIFSKHGNIRLLRDKIVSLSGYKMFISFKCVGPKFNWALPLANPFNNSSKIGDVKYAYINE